MAGKLQIYADAEREAQLAVGLPLRKPSWSFEVFLEIGFILAALRLGVRF
jgi:hypothetical protein